jgi:hypothetical protein
LGLLEDIQVEAIACEVYRRAIRDIHVGIYIT